MADYEQENGDQQFAEDTTNAGFNTEPEITECVVHEETTGGEGDAAPGGAQINASKNDDDERKIFVGGLSWETTVKDLREYFGKHGDVADCTLKTDPTTGRSRGFGFVLFSHSDSVDKVIKIGSHNLHGRNIDPKKAKARGGKEPVKKVFVGGLDPETPEDEIRTYFSKFGKIEEIDLPYDKTKNQRRAFCFITFESEEIVDICCEKPKQTVGAKEVDVKKATPKTQDGFGFGGRGRGWGAGPQRGRGRGRGRGGYDWNQGYDYNNYYNQGGYGGYDSGYYGNYGGYDYPNYYNQGWGNYNQGYGGYGNTGYGNNSYGYDYNGWYGNDQGESNAQGQQSSYGKSNRGAVKTTGGGTTGYHPYNR